jgi:hypothetical protein
VNRFILLCWALSVSVAFADDGIRGQLHLTVPEQAVPLVNEDKTTVQVPEVTYNLRLSNKHKDFTLKNGSMKVKFKIPGGFPNKSLRNFELTGEKIGQPVDMKGVTVDTLLERWSRREYERCTYYDSWTCRRGCYGQRLVLSHYETYRRDFTLEFLEPMVRPDRAVIGVFQSKVGEWDELMYTEPYGFCEYRG